MCPYVVVFFEIGTEVAGAVRIIPEVDGHVGEGGVRDEFAWLAVGDEDAGDT